MNASAAGLLALLWLGGCSPFCEATGWCDRRCVGADCPERVGLSVKHVSPPQGARWCVLGEKGDWAPRTSQGGSRLFLAPRPYHVPDEELMCEVHPRSRISISTIPMDEREGI